jgi:serine/threonine protein kinase
VPNFQLQVLPENNPSYAVKRILHNDPEAFEAEVSNLKRLNKEDNSHLIKLLGTFAFREEYYLLFPWADGNLMDFWKEYPNPNKSILDHKWVLWFSKQCLGIAQGLKAIHSARKPDANSSSESGDQLHGRHGDLKPENILRFRDSSNNISSSQYGVLKISDFGLTRFHREKSKSGINAHTVGNSPTYRAPEYDVMVTVSQSYDIWTLGCVLLEFATWFLLGWDEVDAFSIRRKDEDNAEVKQDNFFMLVSIQEKDGQTGARAKESVAKVS